MRSLVTFAEGLASFTDEVVKNLVMINQINNTKLFDWGDGVPPPELDNDDHRPGGDGAIILHLVLLVCLEVVVVVVVVVVY